MLSSFQLDQINPLRGLDQAGLIALQENAMRGYYARLMWTYFFFEKKHPMVRAVKRRLLSSLGSLKWDIKLADVGEDSEKKAIAERQAQTLRAAYDAIANLRDALNFLALGELRGFSHLEKIYRRGAPQSAIGNLKSAIDHDPWDVIELRPVEQWFWCRQGFYGAWLYNKEAREVNTGAAIDPAHFVIHTVQDPADEIFAEYAIKSKVNDADWDGFLEDYGVPPLFFGMPPNVPASKEALYQQQAELTVSRARGAVPHGTTLLSPSATGSGGAGVFSERLKYIDEQIVIAGTSGKLTVIAESGSGTLAGGAQKEAFDEIAQAIADEISGVMQKQFDLPLLKRTHPDEPVLAYFEFAAVDEEESGKVLEDAGKAKDAGFIMDAAELSEKTGYKLTPLPPSGSQKSEVRGQPSSASPTSDLRPPISSAPAPDPEQINALFSSAVQQLAEAEAADLEPLRRALESAVADPTPEKLQALLDQLAEIQSQLGIRAAEVRQNILGTALVTGLTT
jgi:hypothetical protein